MSERTAIVTGAGSGIGRATSVALSRRGWSLALVGRTRATLDATGAQLAGRWTAHVLDVGDAARVRDSVVEILGSHARIEGLVNNAGLAPSLPIDGHTPELLRQVFDVNAIGPACLIASLWPTFVAQGVGAPRTDATGSPLPRASARIVNVSTMATLDPFPGFLAYAAAKAALNLMAASCASEGRAHAIKGFAVAPGAVETEMLRSILDERALPRDRVLAPEEVARVIVACLEGERDDQNGRTMFIPSP